MDYSEALKSIGEVVTVSDGTVEPPARFNRKLAKWKQNNFTGKLVDVQPSEYYDCGYRACIEKSSSPIMVVNSWVELSSIEVAA